MPQAPNPRAAARAGADTLTGIQYLRGIAAVSVVFHHALQAFDPLGAVNVRVGRHGVDIFFVISGFIMAYTTRHSAAAAGRSAAEFVVKRLIRIVPLYWLALLWTWKAEFLHGEFTRDALRDFLFIPHYQALYPGRIWPALLPGWSINYEMFFYTLFTLAILAGRAKLVVVGLVLTACVGAGQAFAFDGAVARFYTSSILLEFLLGIGVYAAYARWPTVALSPGVLTALCLLGFVLLGVPVKVMRGLEAGLPSALIVWTAIYLFKDARSGLLRLLGDASYSIYLFHIALLTGLHAVLVALGAGALATAAPITAALLLGALAAAGGVAIYFGLENPLLAILRRLAASRMPGPRVLAGAAP